MSTLYHELTNFTEWLLGLVASLLDWTKLGFLSDFGDWLQTEPVVTLVATLLVAVIFLITAMMFGLCFIWEERKFLGRFMDRRGTQVGMLGFFQNFADGIKVVLKEHIVPKDSDHALFEMAIFAYLASTFMLFGCIPFSDNFAVFPNVNLAVLLGIAIFSFGPFAILVGGWASNNKFTLIGGMRAAAQLIALEIPLLLCVVSVVVLTGDLSFVGIVSWQEHNIWLIVPLFIGAVTFFVASVGESERIPFDLPEAEAELVEGWATEYGDVRWGLQMASDYFRAYILCGLFTMLFLGGWAGPDFIWAEAWYLAKTFIVFFFFIWVRAATVRIRTDQILKLGWRRLLPLAVLNLFVAIALKLAGVF
ncbi:MAG: NADH-quinone oxidoreductase subunit H [Methanomassiliicoccales archaeon]|nr:NADH-quinone oxidoreductase subunit H [Methanomassiliicoccales archaeon]